MFTGIDHIIIGVNNLDEATRGFQEKLGLIASGGGIHPSGGTANRIIVIGDTYLELIAVRDPEEAYASMLQRLAKGDGYLNFVLSSNDIEADSTAMARRGVSIVGPTLGQLQAADGRTRGWQRADVEVPDLTQHHPFIIQHDSIGAERRNRLAGWTTPPEHPLGVRQVLSATIAVADLGEASQRFSHIYGLQPSESFSGEVDGWDAMLVSFPLGSIEASETGSSGRNPIATRQHFELAVPLPLSLDADMDFEDLPEPGALARYLQHFGESLCRITLIVENLAASRTFLDERGVTYTYREGTHPVLWIHPDYACGASIVLHEYDPEFVISAGGFPEE